MRKPLVGLALSVLCAAFAEASPQVQSAGHVKAQGSRFIFPGDAAALPGGPERPSRGILDARLNLIGDFGDAFTLTMHGEALSVFSDSLQSSQGTSFGEREVLPSDHERLFDLSKTPFSSANGQSVFRLDRALLSYSGEKTTIKLGRQAISWGDGLVFQVHDLFNPFSPVEVDKDYKTGDDMLYAQYLLESGADWQFLAIPRRASSNGNLNDEESSFALRYRGAFTESAVEYSFLSGWHYDEPVSGVGGSVPIGGALMRANVLFVYREQEHFESLFLVNIDHSWTLCGLNLYTFVEYFGNTMGEAQETLDGQSEAVLERIGRGELFTLGQHYLTLGGQLELSPLLSFYPLHIFHIADRSGFVQLRFVQNLSQNSEVIFGASIPYGGVGSEFGGLRLGAEFGAGLTAAVPSELFVRFGYYF